MNEQAFEFNHFEADLMNLAPLLDASLAIRIHVATVVPAALIGPYLFRARKGTPVHRLMGKVWLGLMFLSALSSFFIHEINLFHGFSPIHLLSAYVLVGCWFAYSNARAHRIAAHKRAVLGLYFGGIVGAGAFTLLPGRIMNKVVFTYPEAWPDNGRLAFFVVVMLGVTALLALAAHLSAPKRPARLQVTERI